MKKEIALVRMECKRIFKIGPVVGVQFLILCVAVLLFVWWSGNLLNQDKLHGKIQVGILMQESINDSNTYTVDNRLTDFALEMLWNMDMLKETCEFRKIEEMQESQELDAVIIFPARMMEGILNGENTPAKVLLYGRDGIREILLEEMVRAGVSVLSVSQAQIYSAYELLTEQGEVDKLPAVQKHLNLYNLKLALEHDRIWREIPLEATGELPESIHFASGGIVLFLLLMGLNCCYFASPENQTLAKQLRRCGYHTFGQVMARLAAVTAFLAVCLLAFLLLLSVCLNWIPDLGEYSLIRIGLPASVKIAVQLMLLVLMSASILVWLLELSDSITSAVFLLVLGSFGLLFVSGGFLPNVFLPDTIRRLGGMLPGQDLIRLASGIFTKDPGLISWMKLAGFFSFFLLASIVSLERRSRI